MWPGRPQSDVSAARSPQLAHMAHGSHGPRLTQPTAHTAHSSHNPWLTWPTAHITHGSHGPLPQLSEQQLFRGGIWKGALEGEGNGESNWSTKDTDLSSAATGRVRAHPALINKPGHIPISARHCRSPQGDPSPCPPRSLSPGTTTGTYQQRHLCKGVTSGHSVLPRSLEPLRQFTMLSLVHIPSSSAQFLSLNLTFCFLNKSP